MSLLTPYVRPLVVALVLLALPGCAAWKASGGPAAIECAGDKLATRAALVVPVVLEALKGEDWQSTLAELGKVVGIDVLGCALQHVHLSVPAVRVRTSKLLAGSRR